MMSQTKLSDVLYNAQFFTLGGGDDDVLVTLRLSLIK